jgi:hypothetical protein
MIGSRALMDFQFHGSGLFPTFPANDRNRHALHRDASSCCSLLPLELVAAPLLRASCLNFNID